MLEPNELEELMDEIQHRVFLANRTGTLDELLEKMGMSDLIKKDPFESYREGKIVVLSDQRVKEKDLIGIVNKLGLDKNRFEFCLDYDKLQKYNYSKLQYSSMYRVVLFGAAPHSSVGKKDSSSALVELQNSEGYPRVIRMEAGNGLKITKTNFQSKLEQLIDEGYI